ncbi:hypothetical protein ACFWFO_23325, partial [Bacillus subtilis]
TLEIANEWIAKGYAVRKVLKILEISPSTYYYHNVKGFFIYLFINLEYAVTSNSYSERSIVILDSPFFLLSTIFLENLSNSLCLVQIGCRNIMCYTSFKKSIAHIK